MRNNTIEEVRATLAINLITILLSKAVAQERLALDAGVDRTVVSKIERAVTNPSIEILLKLANQLDVDLNDLFAN
jgi:transcriptional regulator with XRE-family HTH domain